MSPYRRNVKLIRSLPARRRRRLHAQREDEAGVRFITTWADLQRDVPTDQRDPLELRTGTPTPRPSDDQCVFDVFSPFIHLQFDPDILDVCLRILDSNPRFVTDADQDCSARRDPVYVTRVLSAMVGQRVKTSCSC